MRATRMVSGVRDPDSPLYDPEDDDEDHDFTLAALAPWDDPEDFECDEYELEENDDDE